MKAWTLAVAGMMALSLFSTIGCSRYADFSLPPLQQKAGTLTWRWEVRPAPVLGRGPQGSWDGVDALNPSVAVWNGALLNLYSGYDGKTWRTGLAVSRDGVVWEKRGMVLAPGERKWEGSYIAANGALLAQGNELRYWFQGGLPPQIGMASSRDGSVWTRLAEPVLTPGPRGSWDERGVADPYVVKIEGTLYMYYLGQDRSRRQRLGVARSHDGIVWEKLRANPVLELGEPAAFDERGLGEPAVWRDLDSYWMLYTGRDRKENRRMGLARSQDGVNWTRATNRPVLSGSEAWNSAVVCDATVAAGTQPLKVWFGGGDRPEPAENLHGQIGYATLQLTLTK